MPFTPKNWEDAPSTSTPIDAAALEDLEDRLSDYTDTGDLVLGLQKLNVSVVDAKGDILIGTADNSPDNFPAPANDNVLVADSGQTFGWKGDKIKAANVDATLKPSGSAAAGDEALRAIGSTASTAAAGNHTHSVYDRDQGLPGMYAPMWKGQVSATALTASRAWYPRFTPSRNMTITKIAFFVSTAAGAADAFDVALFSYSGSTLTRLVSSGAITTATSGGGLNSTAGLRVVDISSTALTAGTTYYAGFSVGTFGGTAAQLLFVQGGANGAFEMFGTALGLTEYGFKASSHPHGATVSSTSTGLGSGPLLALRES